MAIIEICDICKKRVSEREGITLSVSDMDGIEWIAGTPIRGERNYKIRVCDRCVENIKTYCRNNISEENNFVEEYNKNKISSVLLDSCKRVGRLFHKGKKYD